VEDQVIAFQRIHFFVTIWADSEALRVAFIKIDSFADIGQNNEVGIVPKSQIRINMRPDTTFSVYRSDKPNDKNWNAYREETQVFETKQQAQHFAIARIMQ
jgi:hypothetical protein